MVTVTTSGVDHRDEAMVVRAGPVRPDACWSAEVRLHGGRVARGAVVEDEVGAHGDGPHREVGVGGDRLGQIGLEGAVGADDHQRVEDGAGVEDASVVVGALRGAETLLLGVDTEDELAARLGVAVETPLGWLAGAGEGDRARTRAAGVQQAARRFR